MADEKRNEEIIVDSELSEKDLDQASGGVVQAAVQAAHAKNRQALNRDKALTRG